MKTVRKDIRKTCGNEYKYELIIHKSEMPPLYSIKIELTMKNGKHTKAETHELPLDEKDAISFFEKLVDNLATPINLPYIIDDELKEHVL